MLMSNISVDWDFTNIDENIYVHNSQDNMILDEVEATISFDRSYEANYQSSFSVKPAGQSVNWIRYDFHGEPIGKED